MTKNLSESGLAIPAIFATLAGTILAIILGGAVGNLDAFIILLSAAVIVGTLWTILGYRIWWLPLFFFVTLGGNFYLGFKLYVHEVAVLISLTPLLMNFIMHAGRIPARKQDFEHVVVVLLIYLIIHYFICIIWNKFSGYSGFGNVTRRYADALWPIIILLPILLYADYRQIKWVLYLIFVGAFLRVILGLSAVWTNREEIIFIPLINYAPPSGGSSIDLRGAGPTLASIAIVFLIQSRNIPTKLLFSLLIILGSYATFLGGSRLALIGLALTFLLPLILYKKWFLIFLLIATIFCSVLLINISPESLYDLPSGARRAASGFILDSKLSAELGSTGLSNEWHMRLSREGFKSWTENFMTIVFGRGVKPFDERAWNTFGGGEFLFEGMIQMAVQTSRFEKGLWDTLCTFGAVGFLLYFSCLLRAVFYLWPVLKNEKISSPIHGFAFLGLFSCLQWILLCWIGNSFPSYNLLLGFTAMAALRWQKETNTQAATTNSKNQFEPATEPALANSR